MTTRQEILDLLANGKITAAEAAELLNEAKTAVSPTPEASTTEKPEPVEKAAPAKKAPQSATAANGEPSWFRVRVRDLDSGKNKVSVNIPLRMLKLGLRFGRRFTDELDEFDYNEMQSMIDEMGGGVLVEVEDDESNEHVQVYID